MAPAIERDVASNDRTFQRVGDDEVGLSGQQISSEAAIESQIGAGTCVGEVESDARLESRVIEFEGLGVEPARVDVLPTRDTDQEETGAEITRQVELAVPIKELATPDLEGLDAIDGRCIKDDSIEIGEIDCVENRQ